MQHWIHRLIVSAALLLVAASPSRSIAGEEPIDIIVHPGSPITQLTAVEAEAIFTRSMTRWRDGSALIPLNLPSGSAERDRFDRVILKLDPDEVTRFWFDRRVRGMGLPPKQVRDSTLMLGVISNLRGAIGYVPASFSHAGVKTVARVAQGKVLPP
jgi:ABC-type phosphate transport system substrate-binding protein